MILDIKNKTQNIDFIALVVTSWHFDNLLAFVRYKSLKKGILIIEPQTNIKDESRYRLSKEQVYVYSDLFEYVCFLRETNLKANYSNFLKHIPSFFRKRESIYIISPNQVNFGFISILPYLKRGYIFVSIDEGIGQYMSKKDFIDTQVDRKYNNQFKNGIVKILIRLLIRNKISFSFYKRKKGLLLPNNIVTKNLEETYRQRTKKQISKKQIIIFFKDFNVISDSAAIELLKGIIANVDFDKYEFIIKKHPNDINEEFDNILINNPAVQVLRNTISGEELISSLDPVLIIAGFSTVTFSCSFIFNIKVVSVINLYRNNDSLNNMNKRIIENFITYFNYKSNLLFPANEKELFNFIQSLNNR